MKLMNQCAINKYKAILSIYLMLLAVAGFSVDIEAGDFKKIEEGVLRAQLNSNFQGIKYKIWIYKPETMIGKVGCVIVPPAGTPIDRGMELGDGDEVEQIPYVKSGYSVISFDIIPILPENGTQAQQVAAMAKFFKLDMGVRQVGEIIKMVKSEFDFIDKDRIFMAGHSSAGTLTLQCAQRLDGLSGVMAYCPVTGIGKRYGPEMLTAYAEISGVKEKDINNLSPDAPGQIWRCPIFLFGSDSDKNVSVEIIKEFWGNGSNFPQGSSFKTGGTGGHYESMIKFGVPLGIQWMAAARR